MRGFFLEVVYRKGREDREGGSSEIQCSEAEQMARTIRSLRVRLAFVNNEWYAGESEMIVRGPALLDLVCFHDPDA